MTYDTRMTSGYSSTVWTYIMKWLWKMLQFPPKKIKSVSCPFSTVYVSVKSYHSPSNNVMGYDEWSIVDPLLSIHG